MNIWYFCLDPRPSSRNDRSAPSIHIMETIQALQARGHHVCYFLYGDVMGQSEHTARQKARRLSQQNFVLSRTKPLARDVYELFRNVQDKSLVESIFRDNPVDAVYERLFHNKTAVSACTRRHGIPLIVESNASAAERKLFGYTPLHFVTGHLEKRVLQRADAVVVVSTPLKKYYEKLGISPKKIFVLPNGVNEKRFSPENVSRDVRAELGLDGSVVLGFVGNIHPYHGIEMFLPLARTFNSSKRDVRFLIVGAGPGLGQLRAALTRENLDHLFAFVDPVPNWEVPNYIAAMDICPLPRSTWYVSPMKILEYGVMGKAIVAPDLENIRDMLAHGETALLFEHGNMPVLIQAIQDLVDDPKLCARLGDSVRRHVLANHTWTKNGERIMAIYDQIMEGSRG